jgi:hypothetical protein
MANGEQVALIKEMSHSFEMYEVTHYRGWRRNAQGHELRLEIEVLDAGVQASNRYHVHVKDSEGRQASGNHADDLMTALHIVHWQDLDQGGAH